MSFMKRIIALLVILSMVFVIFAGCGRNSISASDESENSSVNSDEKDNDSDDTVSKGEDEDEDEDQNEDEGSDSDSDSGNNSDSSSPAEFLALSKGALVLDTFKEFKYEYKTNTDGTEGFISISYVSLGSETIDGVNTEHLKVELVEKDKVTEFEGWYNEKWEAVKYKDSEGEKTGMEAAMSGMSLGMMVQIYSNLLKLNSTFLKEDLTVDEDMFDLKDKSKETVDLGDGSIKVQKFVLSSKFGQGQRILCIAEIDGKSMYTLMETISKDNVTTDSMKVVRAIPR